MKKVFLVILAIIVLIASLIYFGNAYGLAFHDKPVDKAITIIALLVAGLSLFGNCLDFIEKAFYKKEDKK